MPSGLNDAFVDLPVGAIRLKHTLQSTAMVVPWPARQGSLT